MHRVVFCLGSNLGDRELSIKNAIALLSASLGTEPISSTRIINTRAVGFDGPDFLNCLVQYETDIDPEIILDICKRIEKEMGRNEVIEYDEDGKRIYHDRIIDIDILKYGRLRKKTKELTLPHPACKEREFVRTLLKEL